MRSHFGLSSATSFLPIATVQSAVLVERAVIAKAVEIELERLRLHEPAARHVVDHQRGEIGLAGHWAHQGEFREGKTRDIVGIRMRIGHAVEHRLFRRCRDRRGTTELKLLLGHRFLIPFAFAGTACPACRDMTRARRGKGRT
jgi:hypothetical protein